MTPSPVTFPQFITTVLVVLAAMLTWQGFKEWSEVVRIRYTICRDAGGTINRAGECLPLTGRIIR